MAVAALHALLFPVGPADTGSRHHLGRQYPLGRQEAGSCEREKGCRAQAGYTLRERIVFLDNRQAKDLCLGHQG